MRFVERKGVFGDGVDVAAKFVVLNLEFADLLLVLFVVGEQDLDVGLDFSELPDPLPEDRVLGGEGIEASLNEGPLSHIFINIMQSLLTYNNR